MQQAPRRGPTAASNFVIAAILGIPGVVNLVAGITRGGAGDFLCGVSALAYALLLLRDAVHIKKTGTPAMPQSRMLLIGFACLGVYLVGVFLKYR
jgi:hypothetical protein